MTILITGSTGKLGKEVSKLFPEALKPSHLELDIINKEEVEKFFKQNKDINIVIHLAAYVSPPRCEENKELAWDTNVEGTKNLIEACKNSPYGVNTYFLQMSTPCIFSGKDGDLYHEGCIPNPCNFYGFTKAVSEIYVQTSSLKWSIVRSNFVARERYPFPKAFTDRKSAYLYSDVLAREIKKVMEQKLEGIIHIVGNRVMTMFELAKLTRNDIQKYTLEEYYKSNSCKLTKNMTLISTRWPEVKFG